MRRLGARSLMAMLAMSALACAPSASPRVTSAPDMGAPITARLFPPHFGQVAVQVNKPAYIAVFEVVPGRGASLLYPISGSGFVQVEETWVPMRYNAQRWIYTDNRTGVHTGYDMYADGRPGYGSHYGSRIRTSGYGAGGFTPISQPPRYLFMIASEDPIAVEQFQGEVSALRRELGYAQYTSLRADETMEEIATALLPYTADDRWAADVYVDWGYDWGASSGYGATSMFTSMEPVLCSDGIVRYAPWTSGWGFQSLPCTPMQYTRQPGDPELPPPQPGDSVVVPPPSGEGRRRAEGSKGEERSRATSAAAAVTGEEAQALFTQLRARADRSRTADDLNESLRRDVLARQRADRASGVRSPVAGSAQPGSRPNVGVSRRPGTGSAADRKSAAEARREQAERQRERTLDRSDERRRQDVERRQQQREQEQQAAARRQEQQQRQEAERAERSRSTPPAEPSAPSEPAPGRRRVPPAR